MAADLKSTLSSLTSSKGEENLYSHLSKIFSKILLENPKEAFDIFEDFSYDIKFQGYDIVRQGENAERMKETITDLPDYSRRNKILLDVMIVFIGRKSTLEQRKSLKTQDHVDISQILLKNQSGSRKQESTWEKKKVFSFRNR